MSNLIDKAQQIPPGLFDKSVEFMVKDHEIYCLHNGQLLKYVDFPSWIIETIQEDIYKNPKALKALVDWDISDEDEKIRQYICCRFGGFDNNPDIDVNGVVSPAEYVQCGRRGKCAYEGKLCVSIVLENGILTKREIEVLVMIGQAKQDKEICSDLAIEQNTLRNHKNNIEEKAGVQGKVAMAILAHRYQLV